MVPTGGDALHEQDTVETLVVAVIALKRRTTTFPSLGLSASHTLCNKMIGLLKEVSEHIGAVSAHLRSMRAIRESF